MVEETLARLGVGGGGNGGAVVGILVQEVAGGKVLRTDLGIPADGRYHTGYCLQPTLSQIVMPA